MYDVHKLFRAALVGDDDAAPREMLDSIKLEYGPLADLLPQPDPSKSERAVYVPAAHFRDLTIGVPNAGGVLKDLSVWSTPFPPRQTTPFSPGGIERPAPGDHFAMMKFWTQQPN